MTVKDVMQENAGGVYPVKIEQRFSDDECDPYREELWTGMLSEVPEILHTREVVGTGWGIASQRHVITVK